MCNPEHGWQAQEMREMRDPAVKEIPRDPTPAMIEAAREGDDLVANWRRMWDAAKAIGLDPLAATEG